MGKVNWRIEVHQFVGPVATVQVPKIIPIDYGKIRRVHSIQLQNFGTNAIGEIIGRIFDSLGEDAGIVHFDTNGAMAAGDRLTGGDLNVGPFLIPPGYGLNLRIPVLIAGDGLHVNILVAEGAESDFPCTGIL